MKERRWSNGRSRFQDRGLNGLGPQKRAELRRKPRTISTKAGDCLTTFYCRNRGALGHLLRVNAREWPARAGLAGGADDWIPRVNGRKVCGKSLTGLQERTKKQRHCNHFVGVFLLSFSADQEYLAKPGMRPASDLDPILQGGQRSHPPRETLSLDAWGRLIAKDTRDH